MENKEDWDDRLTRMLAETIEASFNEFLDENYILVMNVGEQNAFKIWENAFLEGRKDAFREAE